MQDDRLFMMSPMDAAGEERLRQVRAHIHKAFGPDGRGRRAKRTLEMPVEPPTVAKTPRTKLRQRIKQASQLSADQIFFQQFGSRDELMNTEFDLARPAGHPVPKVSRRFAVGDATSTQSAFYPAQTTGGPTSYFSFGSSSTASALSSSLLAPSTAKGGHLTRPTRIRTPRKAAVKRGRAGESSAEKALVLRKPRLGGASARNLDSTRTTGSQVGAQTAAAAQPPLEARKSFITARGDLTNLPTRFFSGTSPSKFQFSSNATRLFSQRQAPRR